MKVSARESGPWQHTLEIEVPAEDVERRLDEVAREVQRRASLPGFRAGRVPLELVRRNFGETIESRFIDDELSRLTGQALEETKLNAVVPPLIRNVRLTPGSPLRFDVLVDVKPQIEARDYRGLPARRRVLPIDEAAVDRVLNELRDESAVFSDLDRPAERGDVVLLDSQRVDAKGKRLASTRARNQRIELGAPDVLPDLENGLLGSSAGEERTFDVHYPADYPAGEMAGKTVRYVAKIRKIQEKKLRNLDDNLAQEVFKLESLDQVRERIRFNLERDVRVRSQREVETAIADELVRRHSVELPERLVQWMLDRVIAEATEGRPVDAALRQELEKRYRPQVERSIKREVLLDAVARQEQLEVTDEEVGGEIDRMVQADPRQASRVRARYQSAERRGALKESLRERKALEWLIGVAQIQEEVVGDKPLVVPAGR